LLSFGSIGTEINKSKSVAFEAYSNYNFLTQESINILKRKQNETTVMISRVAMQIRTNCGKIKDTFFFGKLTYVLKEEDTNIIRGIPQIYNDNRNIKQQMATG
jgi:hypothetical protein